MPLSKKSLLCGLVLSFAITAQAGNKTEKPVFSASSAEKFCHRLILDTELEVPFFMVGLASIEFKTEQFAAFREANLKSAAELVESLVAANVVDSSALAVLNKPSSMWLIGKMFDALKDRSENVVLEKSVANRLARLKTLGRLDQIFTRFEVLYPSLAPGNGRKPVEGWSEHTDDVIAEWLYRQTVQYLRALSDLQAQVQADLSDADTVHAALDEIEAGLTDLENASASHEARASFTPVLSRFLLAGAEARLAQWKLHTERSGRGYDAPMLQQFMSLALTSNLPLSVLDQRFQQLRKYADRSLTHLGLTDADIFAWVSIASRDGVKLTLRDSIEAASTLDRVLPKSAPGIVLKSSDFIAALDLVISQQFTPLDLAVRLASLRKLAADAPDARSISPSALLVLAQLGQSGNRTNQQLINSFIFYALANDALGPSRFGEATVAALSGLSCKSGTAQNLMDMRTLRSSEGWGSSAPKYAEADWARLYILSRKYGMDIHGIAYLGRRVFELRGEALEADQLISVLASALQAKYGASLAKDAPLSTRILSDDELKSFSIIPYLRLRMPLASLPRP